MVHTQTYSHAHTNTHTHTLKGMGVVERKAISCAGNGQTRPFGSTEVFVSSQHVVRSVPSPVSLLAADDGDSEQPEWKLAWQVRPATPVHQLKFSPDGLLFASVGRVSGVARCHSDRVQHTVFLRLGCGAWCPSWVVGGCAVCCQQRRESEEFVWRRTVSWKPCSDTFSLATIRSAVSEQQSRGCLCSSDSRLMCRCVLSDLYCGLRCPGGESGVWEAPGVCSHLGCGNCAASLSCSTQDMTESLFVLQNDRLVKVWYENKKGESEPLIFSEREFVSLFFHASFSR